MLHSLSSSPGAIINESRNKFNLTQLLNEQIERNETLGNEVAELNTLQTKLLNLLQSKDKQIELLKQKTTSPPSSQLRRNNKNRQVVAFVNKIGTLLKSKQRQNIMIPFQRMRQKFIFAFASRETKWKIFELRVAGLIKKNQRHGLSKLKVFVESNKDVRQCLGSFAKLLAFLEKTRLSQAFSQIQAQAIRRKIKLDEVNSKKKACLNLYRIMENSKRRLLRNNFHFLERNMFISKNALIRDLQIKTVAFFQKKIAATKIILNVFRKSLCFAERRSKANAFKSWMLISKFVKFRTQDEKTMGQNFEQIKRAISKRMASEKCRLILVSIIEKIKNEGFLRILFRATYSKSQKYCSKGFKFIMIVEKIQAKMLRSNTLSFFSKIAFVNWESKKREGILNSKISDKKAEVAQRVLSACLEKRKAYIFQALRKLSNKSKTLQSGLQKLSHLYTTKLHTVKLWAFCLISSYYKKAAFLCLKKFAKGEITLSTGRKGFMGVNNPFIRQKAVSKIKRVPNRTKQLRSKFHFWRKLLDKQIKLNEIGVKNYMDNLNGIVKLMESSSQERESQLEEKKIQVSQLLSDKLQLEKVVEAFKLKNSVLTSSLEKFNKENGDLGLSNEKLKRELEKEKGSLALQAENLRKDKEDLLDKLAVSFTTLKEMKLEFERLQEKHRLHELEKLEFKREIKIRDDKIVEMNEKLSIIEGEMMEIQKSRSKDKEIQNKSDNKENRDSQNTKRQEIKKKRADSKDGHEKMKGLEEKLTNLKKVNAELTKEAILLNEEKLQHREELTSLKEENKNLSKALGNSEIKHQELLQALQKHRDVILYYEEKDKSVPDYINQILEEKKSLELDNKRLCREMESLKAQFGPKGSKIQDELAQLKKEIQEKKTKEDAAQAEIKDLKDTIGNMNREKVNLMREMTLIHDNNVKLEKELNRFKDLAKQSQIQIEGYQYQMDLYAKVLKSMEDQVQSIGHKSRRSLLDNSNVGKSPKGEDELLLEKLNSIRSKYEASTNEKF